MVLGHPFLENSVPPFGPSVTERCTLCCHLTAVLSQGQAPLAVPSLSGPTHPAAQGTGEKKARSSRCPHPQSPGPKADKPFQTSQSMSYLLFSDCFPTMTNSENRKRQERERKGSWEPGRGYPWFEGKQQSGDEVGRTRLSPQTC